MPTHQATTAPTSSRTAASRPHAKHRSATRTLRDNQPSLELHRQDNHLHTVQMQPLHPKHGVDTTTAAGAHDENRGWGIAHQVWRLLGFLALRCREHLVDFLEPRLDRVVVAMDR